MNVSGSTSHLDHNILFASQGVTVSISIYRQFNICIENSGFHNIDFYSYSIIAVGLALCLGITMPYNFDNPYSAQSFKDFWKKWNITLSSWLKDYIYIPLGGNHKSKYLTQLNVLITFIISGLWHGLSFPFIFWGIFL